MSNLQVNHQADQQRYIALLDGKEIGHLSYQGLGDTVMLTHTEIDPQFNGKGYGGQLVGLALDDLREHNKLIVPKCSFVAGYLEKHPEYMEIVHPNQRGSLGMKE